MTDGEVKQDWPRIPIRSHDPETRIGTFGGRKKGSTIYRSSQRIAKLEARPRFLLCELRACGRNSSSGSWKVNEAESDLIALNPSESDQIKVVIDPKSRVIQVRSGSWGACLPVAFLKAGNGGERDSQPHQYVGRAVLPGESDGGDAQ